MTVLVLLAGVLAIGTTPAPSSAISECSSERRADTTRPAQTPAHYAPEAGRLPRRYVAPDVYDANVQNWDAVQDSTGRLYVANTEGVLLYDGRSWTLVPTANRSIARSVAVGPDGRVYVGAQREIGVLRRDSTGHHRYASLLDRVPDSLETFTNVWRTETTSEGVYFQSYRRLFRWAPDADTMQSWAPSTQFQLADEARNTLYVNSEGRGLLAAQGDSLRLVPGGERFADRTVWFVLPHREDGLMVGTSNGLFVRNGDAFRPFPTDVDPLLNETWPPTATRTPDGSIAIGTVYDGLLLLGPNGDLRRHLPARGAPVQGLYADHEGELWGLLGKGLLRYDLAAPFTEHGPATGLEGTIEDIERHRGTLYVATNQGTSRLRAASDSIATFAGVPALNSESWTLLSVGEDLLAGTVNGLTVRAPDGTTHPLVEDTPVYDLLRSRSDASRLYAATQRGVRPLTKTDGRWTAGERLPGLTTQARDLAAVNDSTLWVATNFDTVYRVRGIGSGESTRIDTFGTEHGLPSSRVVLFRWNDELTFGTRTGLFRFVEKAKPPFQPLSSVEMPPGVGRDEVFLERGSHREAWGDAGTGPGRWTRRDTLWRWTPGRLHRLRNRQVNTLQIENSGQTIWMGTHRAGLVRYTPDVDRRDATVAPQIHRVYAAGTDSTVGRGPGEARPELPYALGGVRLTYSAPSLVDPEAVEYQYRLGGRQTDWSSWTPRTEQSFPTLAPGDYVFEVRARTAYGDTTRPARYTFAVLPPWYRTAWAYALYVLLALGLGGAAVQWRTRRLRRRQEALENTVAERTEEIRQKNDQLAQQAERLQELDEAKSRFFANVSHEFRTPLTLIQGPAQELRERLRRGTLEPQEDTERLALIQRNAGRLQRLIDQILGLARLDAGTYQLDARPTDLASETERIARRFEPLAERHGLTLRAEIGEEAPDSAAPVFLDREALEHVIDNLLSNAIKFTPEGGTVTVTVEETADEAAIHVQDTGPGIPEEEHEEIFDRFQQVDDTSTRPEEGAGIGLAFANDLVDLHGGTLTLDSTEGAGTTVTAHFPRGPEHLADAHRADEDPPESSTSDAPRPSPLESPSSTEKEPAPPEASDAPDDQSKIKNPKSKIVLVVDDNADVRRYVRQVLTPEYEVLEAADGEEGAEKAREQLPDVILADVMMPGTDGHEMTRRLKGDPETEAIPIIMVTARAETSDEVAGLQAGADDYVTKPFDADVLRQRVGGVLTLQERLRRRLREELDAEAEPSADTDATAPEARPEIEQEARTIIRQHLTEPNFSVTDLADALAMSESTLYRRLTEKADTTPSTLLTQIRIEEAKALLRDGEPVTQVAYAVGYESLSGFSRVFREETGQSPSTYVPDATP